MRLKGDKPTYISKAQAKGAMLAKITQRMAAACERTGRDPSEVKLVAVTKGHTLDEIQRVLLDKGHLCLGENRIQEWRDKAQVLEEAEQNAEWHLIGNLQRNKVKYCLPFSLIHSLNSVRLADELQKQGDKKGHTFKTLIEVNVADEDSKLGISTEETEDLVTYVQGLSHVQVEGLMTIAPYVDNPNEVRHYFTKLRNLRDKLSLRELSMGMSGDFEVAIEEGATIVRVGSALFA